MQDPKPKAAGTWDFRGAYAPEPMNDGTYRGGSGDNFTLGCFQWVPKSRGEGTKMGRVTYRVKGSRYSPAKAFTHAKRFCAEKNAASQE